MFGTNMTQCSMTGKSSEMAIASVAKSLSSTSSPFVSFPRFIFRANSTRRTCLANARVCRSVRCRYGLSSLEKIPVGSCEMMRSRCRRRSVSALPPSIMLVMRSTEKDAPSRSRCRSAFVGIFALSVFLLYVLQQL